MRILLIIILLTLPGCTILEGNSARLSNTIDTILKQEPGWNMSGYIVKNTTSETKFGLIDSEILYNMVKNCPKEPKLEEDIKDEGFLFGIFFKKTF